MRDLAAGGFSATALVSTVAKRSRALTARDPSLAYCQGTPLRTEIEQRDKSLLAAATDAGASAIAERFGPGPVDGKIQAHIVVVARDR